MWYITSCRINSKNHAIIGLYKTFLLRKGKKKLLYLMAAPHDAALHSDHVSEFALIFNTLPETMSHPFRVSDNPSLLIAY